MQALPRIPFVDSVLNSGLDPSTTEPELFRQISVFNVAMLAGIFTALALGTMYLWISTFLAFFHLVTAIVFVLAIVGLRVSRRPTICGRVVITYLFLFLAVVIWKLGALQTSALAWLVVVPIGAAVIVGIRDAWFWIAATALLAVAYFIANRFGIQPPNIIEPDFRAFAHLCFHVSFTFVIGILITTWLTRQRVLELQLNRSLLKTEDAALNARVLADAATAANEGAVFEVAAEDCLRIICDVLDCEGGHVWIRNEDGLMLPAGISKAMGNSVFAPLIQTAEETDPGNQKYLPRVVAESGREIVATDLARDPRAAIGNNIELRSVLVWPVIVDGVVDAVLEFFSCQPVEIDPQAKQLLNHVALQLAYVRGRELSRGRIEQLAYYDAITGLPNRYAFERRFGPILEVADKRNRHVALMFIDLDGFKHVNDSLGHAAGDRLLRSIGEKLSDNLRASDFAVKPNSTNATMVARVGGDEFIVVLQDLTEHSGAEIVARRFVEIVSQPIDIDGQEVSVGASIGIAVYPDDAKEPSDILRLADAAMYQAKRAAGSQYRFATEALNERVRRRTWLENELRRAVSEKKIQTHYQSIIDAQTGNVSAFEALARWQHDGHWIEPSEFIRLAEETGIIYSLGNAVLGKACADISSYNQTHQSSLRVCVNVSPHQLRQEDFIANITSVLRETHCQAQWLTLEITETSLIVDDSGSIDLLNAVRELGIGIALDDFGTGYASLSYLRKFPFNYVKIDKSFIHGIEEIREDDAIVRAITTMSHTLGLEVIAEGIESDAQADCARALGCDALQGSLFGQPSEVIGQ